jgi:predicted ester cyclase
MIRCQDSQPAWKGPNTLCRRCTAPPDLQFTIDDLVAERDRVTIRWTLRGTKTGPMLGRPPSGEPVELAAIVIFRIADGKIAERWAGWKPGCAPGR